MAPIVILIRHAQAVHNATQNYTIPDPPLTEHGFGPQCEELSQFLQNHVPIASKVELIVVSPLRRTLQTATQSLGWLMEKGVPVQLRADWQENSDSPCDIGSPIAAMSEEWPQFDWSAVDPTFPAKTGLYTYTLEALTQRGVGVRRWLMSRPERVIAVVSHSAFLRGGVSNRKFAHADFRIFDLVQEQGQGIGMSNGDDVADAKLVEWELTESKGGGMGRSPKGFWSFNPDEEITDGKLLEAYKLGTDCEPVRSTVLGTGHLSSI